jgi:uncharacterized lipoprotein YddW (UPF0748 family)
MKRISGWIRRLSLIGFLVLVTWGGYAAARGNSLIPRAYLPFVSKPPPPPLVEFRGLWLSRFFWTGQYNVGTPDRIDEIVAQAAGANFNAILFQVRGTGDALYTPGLEPWSERLNGDGKLGENPGWDPLAHMIDSAHAAGLEVHAYINVYPTWYGATDPPEAPVDTTIPLHPFWTWSRLDGPSPEPDWADWRHWNQDRTPTNIEHRQYLWASPGAPPVADHVAAVVQDLVARYVLDGVHLDYIRYAGPEYSCDPYSEDRFGADCFSPGWEDWQRAQISALVADIYGDLPSDVMLSAAVWAVYEDRWNLGISEGRNFYYQDSQGWANAGIIDALMPMIYPSNYTCPDTSVWTQDVWSTLASDFQDHSNGRHIVAGIGGGYCTFDEIAWRIERGRTIGTAGHAIYSWYLINSNDYWDEFIAPGGPHEEPALVPDTTWRP